MAFMWKLNRGHLKRIFINFKRENDLLKVFIVTLISITIGLLFKFKLKLVGPGATIVLSLCVAAIPLVYSLVLIFLIEMNIINKINIKDIGPNGEIRFSIEETRGDTSITISLEKGFYKAKNSFNVTSLIDCGYGVIGINFALPFKDSDYTLNIAGEKSLDWQVVSKNLSSVVIKFSEEPKLFNLKIIE